VLKQPGTLVVEEVEDPSCGDDEVIVKVAQCGICGTDRSIFRGEYSVGTPAILGHEYSGTVVEVGSKVNGVSPSDRVVVDPNVVDDVCFYCRSGSSNLCTGLSPLGVARPGGFAEYSVVPARYLYEVPDGVSLAEASLVEPLACCVRGIDQAGIDVGDVVVVSGAGPIGCLLIQLARLAGAATILAVEPSQARREHGLLAGSDIVCAPDEAVAELTRVRGTIGADVVIEASGSPASAEVIFRQVRRGGTVLLFGVYPVNEHIAVSPFRVNEDELRVVGSLNNPNTHQRAIDLIATRRVQVDSVVTHRLGLDLLAKAMDLTNFPTAGKIAIDLQSD